MNTEQAVTNDKPRAIAQTIHDVPIYTGERVDDLHRNGFLLIQNPSRFCFGVDAVILTGFAKVRKNESVLDICTGSGVIPILLAGKTPGQRFDGLEIQTESVEMARRSVQLNGLSDHIDITEGDVKNALSLFPPSSYDVVTCNPPYMRPGAGIPNSDTPRTIARHETLCTLDDIIHAAAKLLKPQGRLYMVHRPERLADLMVALRTHNLEPKTLRFVHSRIHKPPILILVEATRNGKPALTVPPPLVIYENDSDTYTAEIQTIYYS